MQVDLIDFFKVGQPRPLFCLFLSFRTENLSSQQDSNLDCRSRRQERWPLDHHHGPSSWKILLTSTFTIFQVLSINWLGWSGFCRFYKHFSPPLKYSLSSSFYHRSVFLTNLSRSIVISMDVSVPKKLHRLIFYYIIYSRRRLGRPKRLPPRQPGCRRRTRPIPILSPKPKPNSGKENTKNPPFYVSVAFKRRHHSNTFLFWRTLLKKFKDTAI